MSASTFLLFAAFIEGTVRVINARISNYVYELRITLDPGALIRCLAVSSSGVVGNWTIIITLLDSKTGHIISTCKTHESEIHELVAYG
ncbi:hypothetical protein FQR65_LT11602 [Abscondita terminalis]|nr:hypothetical protein FQR65_LT11602 [Abscondita terminalis]